jgi:hypothetical protein
LPYNNRTKWPKACETPLKKTLKDLKSTWIVGHIKVLRILRETYKSACNSSHKSKNNGLKHLKHLCKKNKNK